MVANKETQKARARLSLDRKCYREDRARQDEVIKEGFLESEEQ